MENALTENVQKKDPEYPKLTGLFLRFVIAAPMVGAALSVFALIAFMLALSLFAAVLHDPVIVVIVAGVTIWLMFGLAYFWCLGSAFFQSLGACMTHSQIAMFIGCTREECPQPKHWHWGYRILRMSFRGVGVGIFLAIGGIATLGIPFSFALWISVLVSNPLPLILTFAPFLIPPYSRYCDFVLRVLLRFIVHRQEAGELHILHDMQVVHRQRRPWVIAFPGEKERAEDSLAQFRLAWEQGADGIACKVGGCRNGKAKGIKPCGPMLAEILATVVPERKLFLWITTDNKEELDRIYRVVSDSSVDQKDVYLLSSSSETLSRSAELLPHANRLFLVRTLCGRPVIQKNQILQTISDNELAGVACECLSADESLSRQVRRLGKEFHMLSLERMYQLHWASLRCPRSICTSRPLDLLKRVDCKWNRTKS